MNNGGPAFPLAGKAGDDRYQGMSRREWLAGQAISAWIIVLGSRQGQEGYSDTRVTHEASKLALMTADAMLQIEEGTSK